MKTTLNIDDTVMAELKRDAARQGRTMSELVETAPRPLLRSPRKRGVIRNPLDRFISASSPRKRGPITTAVQFLLQQWYGFPRSRE